MREEISYLALLKKSIKNLKFWSKNKLQGENFDGCWKNMYYWLYSLKFVFKK